MALYTRSTAKKLAQIDRRYHVFIKTSTPLPQIITRSLSRSLKLMGIKIPTIPTIPKMKRRNSCYVPKAKPARRAIRSQTLQGRTFVFLI